MGSVGVVVAHHDPAVAERVAELLERAPDLFVAATSVEQARAGNVVIAGGEPLLTMGPQAHPVVVLAEERAVLAARRAIELAAREIVAWPSEADRLAGAVRRAAAPVAGSAHGRLITVMGARGGLGTSTIAAALAASMPASIVLDLSPGGGQRAFCEGEPARTVQDLAAAHADPPPEAIEASLHPHAGGTRCLHTRPFADMPAALHLIVHAARALAPTVIADRGVLGASSGRADRCVVVVGNDVMSVRAALANAPEHATYLIRRVRRGGVPVRDVAAALGAQDVVVIPHDAGLARAVDLGTLPARGSRAMKRIRQLVESLA